ncbi:bifunctional folylpolyglutamate synthase/dihydrofolate synthase [Streptococcus orisasini]|uniref:bifunctional folylpolyglutamate synthase/dihydrofolate synthase n=1 Tax=Streptococcus orisasini TaxID=1080071 RepID=UPI000709EA7B|nr:folylpolyglutamate synthase/dihydrofolate synthase family protein [Streptococcus orisasini]
MNYQEALAWINGNLKFGIKPGIDRMAWMLEKIGNPQKNICGIHVVGTNGKGSTVNYLQNIFSQAGYNVGTFTSPYIIDFRERISVNGQMISKEELVSLVQLVKPVVERLPLETDLEAATEFEIITLLMFVYFGQVHPVDVAIIEAGMGGQTDSTNVFKAQAVICTSIGLDHQAVLGNTHAEIAGQKAGVLKDKVPFIFAEKRSDVKAVFYQKAKETHSPLYQLGEDFKIWDKGAVFDFSYGSDTISDIRLVMKGKHQRSNAALAVMASLLLQKEFPKVTKTVIKSALANSRWAGRTEFIRENLMIDGAHNNESVAVLTDLLQEQYADRNIHVLFAAIAGKPVETMLARLSQLADVTVTAFPYPRALTLEDYPSQYEQVSDFSVWLKKFEKAEKEDLYVITGSLYFISQVRKELLKNKEIGYNRMY